MSSLVTGEGSSQQDATDRFSDTDSDDDPIAQYHKVLDADPLGDISNGFSERCVPSNET